MKTSKISILLCVLSIMALTLGSTRVMADQPVMNQAIEQLELAKKGEHHLDHLEKAKQLLEQARRDKGGERKEAIQHINEAMVAARKDERKRMETQIDLAIADVREGKREFAGWQALDGNDASYWATDDAVTKASLEFDTEGGREINMVRIGEASGFENRVQAYQVEGMVDSAWKLLSQGTTIGHEKVDRFPKVTVWKVKLTILDSKSYPAIRELGIYLQPDSQSAR